jgi:hypothetical protein
LGFSGRREQDGEQGIAVRRELGDCQARPEPRVGAEPSFELVVAPVVGQEVRFRAVVHDEVADGPADLLDPVQLTQPLGVLPWAGVGRVPQLSSLL